ncbi:hypothetical protein ONR57_11950 [Hoyosella sp. YIM 151337]|nr:hypothetical protein [Hoyosella sp. YIM 151337]MCW4354012.1 hypothetical protein [Hoyosella sp. YIM 151337]
MGSIEIAEYLPVYLTQDLPRLIVAAFLALGTAFGSIDSPL